MECTYIPPTVAVTLPSESLSRLRTPWCGEPVILAAGGQPAEADVHLAGNLPETARYAVDVMYVRIAVAIAPQELWRFRARDLVLAAGGQPATSAYANSARNDDRPSRKSATSP